MRQIRGKDIKKYACDECVNFKNGRICPFEYCIYYEDPPEPKKIVFKKPKKEEPPPEPKVPTLQQRCDMFPSVTIYERYDVAAIIEMAERGMMAVEIAEKMKIRPQVVADIIKSLKKGERDVFQNVRILRMQPRPGRVL